MSTIAGRGLVGVVIMNGGGADVIGGVCDDPPTAACDAPAGAAQGARDLFARTAADGVSHIIYAFYPNPTTAGSDATASAIWATMQEHCIAP
jgi:hypothetical protein